MTQFFSRNDDFELKMFHRLDGVFLSIATDLDDFYEGLYTCVPLGEMLYDTMRAPLSNAIPREIFIESFATIFESFQVAGTFESYIEVFQNIFGDDAEIEFTVPSAGQLEINITSTGLATFGALVRTVVDNVYVLEPLVTSDGDRILFVGVKGFENQADLDRLLIEMVPAGIYSETTLDLGG